MSVKGDELRGKQGLNQEAIDGICRIVVKPKRREVCRYIPLSKQIVEAAGTYGEAIG